MNLKSEKVAIRLIYLRILETLVVWEAIPWWKNGILWKINKQKEGKGEVPNLTSLTPPLGIKNNF